MEKREKLSSRLGFIFLSAGCAIGLGNIWRFPYITGKYGGGAFVLLYLFFLLIMGLPIIVMEFSMGRASKKSIAQAFHVLEPKGTKWHWFSYLAMAGNYLLIMFYSTLAGWMLSYFFKALSGQFNQKSSVEIAEIFASLQANPAECVFFMAMVISIGLLVCSLGLQKGVEKITKGMMSCLLIIMLILVVRSITLPKAMAGLQFYLVPDFNKLLEQGLLDAVYTAMGQAFFTLSIGMGGMMIFGSYTSSEHTLPKESLNILLLDTFVAITAGLIIFPACFAYNVDAGSGPGLVFVTLPNIFNAMSFSQLWATLFFLFMNFASVTTIIAVFENIVCFSMDLFGFTRKKSVLCCGILLLILSLPCALGSNLLSGIQPFGAGSAILDLEDFLVSNFIMPIGAVVFIFFCTTKKGWGWQAFLKEANTGKGIHFPAASKFLLQIVLPVLITILFVAGLADKFL